MAQQAISEIGRNRRRTPRLQGRAQADEEAPARCRLEVTPVGLVDDHRADVAPVGHVVDAAEQVDAGRADAELVTGAQVEDRVAWRGLGVEV